MAGKKLLLLIFLLTCHIGVRSQTIEEDIAKLRVETDTLGFPEQEHAWLALLEKSRRGGDSMNYAKVSREIGIVYRNMGNYVKSIEYSLISLGIFERHGERVHRSITLMNLANAYYLLGDFRQALAYYHQVYSSYLEEEEEYIEMLRSDVTLNMAQVYYELDSLQSARIYAEKSIEHIRKSSDTSAILWQYIMLGAVCQKERKYEQARHYYLLSLNATKRGEDPFMLAMALENIGLLYEDLGNKDSAAYYLEEAISKAYLSRNPELISRIAEDLSHLYESSGDSLNAYQYLKIHTLFTDSLLNEKRIQAIIDAEKRYQAEAKSMQIEAQQVRLRQRRYAITGLIVLLLLAGAVFTLVIRNRNKTAMLTKQQLRLKEAEINEMIREQELKSMDAMMKGQDEERKRIARELHDRLGSMLSTVKLHFTSIEEEIKKLQEKQHSAYESALGMLDEAVDEVRKISHDLHSGIIDKFGLKTAVNQLIGAIEMSNAIRIRFMDNGVDPALYSGIEVELYRIIQELISNTLKHSEASEATIQLNFSSGLITFTYEDNGMGMDPAKLKDSEGIGLLSIESRVKKINGAYSIDTRPGHGFTFIIEIPV